jgi:hypothetical protein
MNSAHQWNVMDMFEFDCDGSDFKLAPDFLRVFESSRNPFIILFIGNTRAGKSTRINQLLTRELKAISPFVAAGGAWPITKAFQSATPLTFEDLSQIHGISLSTKSHPDIFLVDCEGLHSLEETSPGLKKATFALAQISSLIVLVMKEQLCFDNLISVRSLFALSRAFGRDVPGFSTGTILMQREVGVRCPESASLMEQDGIRRGEDRKFCELCQKSFAEKNLPFASDELRVLCQPDLDKQPELYWKSMADLLEYACEIADRRSNFSARNLLDIFGTVNPHIMNIKDFENPNIPLEEIFGQVVDGYLCEAVRYAEGFLNEFINEPFSKMSREQLKRYPNIPEIDCAKTKMHDVFVQKANELNLHPHIVEYDPDQLK